MSRPRASIVLQHRHRMNQILLGLEESDLTSQIAYRGDHITELKRAARSTNDLVRSNYATFIHEVGRNVYPLIIFTDYEVDGPTGVGSTLTLYRADGSVTRVSPAMSTNYELYKAASHVVMGLAVEIGPHLLNVSCGDFLTKNSNGDGSAGPTKGCNAMDAPWRGSVIEYVQRVRTFRRAIIRAAEVEALVEDMDKLSIDNQEGGGNTENKHGKQSHDGLPSLEMREVMCTMLSSVIDFCEVSLSTGVLNIQDWKELNHGNFHRIKQCMMAATKSQADSCVPQIIEWRDMMGPKEWRDLYVIIPTVWAVGAENPRKTMLAQLMDEDRVDTHIISSEHPRDHGEARTLLGRVVGDRAIGRFVFGDETKEQQIKTMGLSSEVDVVQDDALPAIWDALRSHGCPVRPRRSINVPSREGSTGTMQNGERRSSRNTFCSL